MYVFECALFVWLFPSVHASYALLSTADAPTNTRVGADADSERPVLRPPPSRRGGDPFRDENTSCSPCDIITTSRSGGVTCTPDMTTLAIGDVRCS